VPDDRWGLRVNDVPGPPAGVGVNQESARDPLAVRQKISMMESAKSPCNEDRVQSGGFSARRRHFGETGRQRA